MSNGFLAEHALSLIKGSIRSVWALEVLLLLRTDGRAMTPDELVRELHSSRGAVDDILVLFRQNGLVEQLPENTFRYRAATSDLELGAQALELAYSERPLAVIKAILDAPNDRLQTFSDAFKLKRN